MRSLGLLAAAALLLVGCAGAGVRLNARRNPNLKWVGASEADLIREWGVPDGQTQAGDSKIIEYRRRERVIYNDDGTAGRRHFDVFTFEIQDGKVTNTKCDRR
jgi:hypothetical protein